MKRKKLLLWSKTDIAAMLGVDVKQLPDLLTEELKTKIKMNSPLPTLGKYKRFKLNDVRDILLEVYPFKTEQQINEILMPY